MRSTLISFPVNVVEGYDPMAKAEISGTHQQMKKLEEKVDGLASTQAVESLKAEIDQLRGVVEGLWGPRVRRRMRAHWVVSLGLLVSIVGIMSTAYFEWYLPLQRELFESRIGNVLSKPDGVMAKLNEISSTANATKTSVDTLTPFIHDVVAHQFESFSKLPKQVLIERAPAAEHLASIAQENKVKADPRLVEKVGLDYLAASEKTPSLWNTTLAFVSYQSSQTIPKPPSGFARPSTPARMYPDVHLVTGRPRPHIEYYSSELQVSPGQAALIMSIGATPKELKEQEEFGAIGFVLTGGDMSLDNALLKHIIIRDVTVHYSGAAPVLLDDVVFVNCKFVFDPNPYSRNLARNLLAATSAISFSTQSA